MARNRERGPLLGGKGPLAFRFIPHVSHRPEPVWLQQADGSILSFRACWAKIRFPADFQVDRAQKTARAGVWDGERTVRSTRVACQRYHGVECLFRSKLASSALRSSS